MKRLVRRALLLTVALVILVPTAALAFVPGPYPTDGLQWWCQFYPQHTACSVAGRLIPAPCRIGICPGENPE